MQNKTKRISNGFKLSKSKLGLGLILAGILLFGIRSCGPGYENTGKHVYYNQWNEADGFIKDLIDADPKTFKVLKNDAYAKDANKVFYEGQIIKGADASTFESLKDFYARDKNHGYYADSVITTSRGATFRDIDSYYSTDGVDIFYTNMPLKVKTVKNFRIAYRESDWERWTTDGEYYYFKNYKIPSDDYKHVIFFKGSGGLAADLRWVYFKGNKINYDDSGKRVIDTVDIATFKVTGYLECRDKFGCINPFHGRESCSNN